MTSLYQLHTLIHNVVIATIAILLYYKMERILYKSVEGGYNNVF